MLTSTFVQGVAELLSTPQKIVIICHKNPDGDAIGSSLGWYHILKNAGHSVEIVVPNDFPKHLKWMPDAKKICIAEYKKRKAEVLIQDADVLFLLDFNTLSRIDQLATLVEKSTATKVLIDHHQQPDAFDFVFSDTEIPATCELIYHTAVALQFTQHINADAAQCLYAGILTDTGVFKFASVKPSTHEVAAELMKHGAQPHQIHEQLFESSQPSRLFLLKEFLGNMQLFPEYQTVLFTLTREKLLELGFQKGDTEGFVNYGLGMQDYVFSVFMAEDTQQDIIKISFRSKGDFNVNTFARAHFNGGGHNNAAGGRSDKSLQETVEEFIHLLPNYQSELNPEQ